MTPRLRAPQHDDAVLALPPLVHLPQQIQENRAAGVASRLTIAGRAGDELRRLAQREAVEEAGHYLQSAGEPLPTILPTAPFLVAGHQPELFHPGVWVKNFALSGVARTAGAVPLNLVVDNDTAKSTALHLPVRDADGWKRRTLPFDRWESEVPYEERPVLDEATFAGFADQARSWWADWPFRPLLDEFWQEVRRQAARTPLLGERFAAARRALERRWGCHNLEVPVSRMCQGEAFAWFACHLLIELPRLHADYNAAVHAYRRRHGLRSRSHPVPDLAAEGDWLEAPLWAWRAGPGRRGRLLARTTATGLELRVGGDRWPTLPRDPSAAVAAWRGLEGHGYKVRSRALTTTLFARFFLADVFVHGIGGATYDELTDEIARRFFGTAPPSHAVLSATLLLPLPAASVQPEDRPRLVRLVRDLRYNPQRHLSEAVAADPKVRELLRQKQELIRQDPADPAERKGRFQTLRTLTDQLHPHVADQETTAGQELKQCEQLLQDRAVLERRDYAFCLFPEEKLLRFCTRFLI